MKYIIDGKSVELDGEDEVKFLVSMGCDESRVREMLAIEAGSDGCLDHAATHTIPEGEDEARSA